MDPKALSHLDPKQKEAYARIMGTAAATTGGDPNASVTSQNGPATPDNSMGGLTSSPLPSAPVDTTSSLNTVSTPQSTTSPGGSPSVFSASPVAPPTQDNTAPPPPPPTSSFFTNTSPGNTDTSPVTPAPSAFSPVEPPKDLASSGTNDPLSPVTPYIPTSEEPQSASSSQPFSQPLPSPASVNQALPHEASPLLRVLYIVGAVVFFAIYTIFWIKVFKLPFLF